MKNLRFYLLTTSIFIFFGCQKDDNNPIALFEMDKSTATVGEVIKFNNQSQNATSYEWDFGDGNISTDENPTHAYSVEGTYTVILNATGKGGENSTSKILTVVIPPEASFSLTKDTFYVDEIIKFTNSSKNATTYSWNFGDNNSSAETSPTHSFSSKGVYNVILTASNATVSDSYSKELSIVNFSGDKVHLSPSEEHEFFYSTHTSFAPSTFEVSYSGEGEEYFSHTGIDFISFIYIGPGDYYSAARFNYKAAANIPRYRSYIGEFTIAFKSGSNTSIIEENAMFIID